MNDRRAFGASRVNKALELLSELETPIVFTEGELLSKEVFIDLTESLISEWFLLNFPKVNTIISSLCNKASWIKVPELRDMFECDATSILIEIFDLEDDANDALRAYEETDQTIVTNSLALFAELLRFSSNLSDETVFQGMNVVLNSFHGYSPDSKVQAGRLMKNGFTQKSNRPLTHAETFTNICLREATEQSYTDVCMALASALSIMAKKSELIPSQIQRRMVDVMEIMCRRGNPEFFRYVSCCLFYLLKNDEDSDILNSAFVRDFICQLSKDPLTDESCFYICEILIVCILRNTGNLEELIPDFSVFHRFLLGQEYNQHAILKLLDLVIAKGQLFVQKFIEDGTLHVLIQMSDNVDFPVRRLITFCLCDAFTTGTVDQIAAMTGNGCHELIISTLDCHDPDITESVLEALVAIARTVPEEIDNSGLPSLLEALPEASQHASDCLTLLRSIMSEYTGDH